MSVVVAVKKRLPGVLLSQWLLLVGLFGLALALGLYRIGPKSIWYDEAVSVQYARADLSALAKYVSGDANGALYYFLLHWWIGLVGYGEAAVRSFSAVFAAGSVPLLYLIARRWLDPVAAVAASLLFATSQMFIDYAQEARMYALALFLVLAATLVLQIAVERRSMRWWWLYALVAVLALYAHLWTALVLLAHAIWLVTCERAHLRRALVVSPVVIALSLPMIVYAVIGPDRVAWIGPLSESQIFYTLLELAGGSWPLFVVAGQAILRVGWLARTGRREYVLPLLMGVVPIVATIAISLVKPMLMSRYLFFAVPSLAVVCVIAAFSLKPRGVAVLAAAWLVAVSATTGAWWYTRAPHEDYRGATLAVTVRAQAGDVVLLNPGWLWPGYDYYIDRLGLAGKPPARTGQWQIEQAWPPVVWIISLPAPRDADIAPFVQTLKQHGYKVDGPPVSVVEFVIRRYVRPKA